MYSVSRLYSPQMLTAPLADLDAWVAHFSDAEIPVLRRTARWLDAYREDTETLNARGVAGMIAGDPLMTLRVLAHISTHKARGQLTDIESVEGAMLMMGLPKFFKTFSNLALVEERLKGHSAAHLGLMRVIARAHRASAFAHAWAVHRRDLDIREILLATQLHDMAEMLLYCFAPELALKLADLQRRNPKLRSRVAQKEVLGIVLQDLESKLMRRWMLPELLVQMIDHAHADHPRVRNVICAVNLARHSANSWEDPALPDDYDDIAQLLSLSPERVAESVRQMEV